MYFYDISRSPPTRNLSQDSRDSLLHQLQKFISSDTKCKFNYLINSTYTELIRNNLLYGMHAHPLFLLQCCSYSKSDYWNFLCTYLLIKTMV